MESKNGYSCLWAAILLFLAACGVAPSPSTSPGSGSATLVVFGAGYCESCKHRFPELKRHLDAVPGKERLTVRIYLTAGSPPSVRPTQAMADDYRDHYFLGAQSAPDPWRWQNFQRLLPGQRLEVPAAVVLSPSGAVLRTYTAGDTVFVPSDIAHFIRQQLVTR